MSNLLKNPGFEGEWTRDTHTGVEFGEIFTPQEWVTWWSHQKEVPHDPENQVGYARPETKVIPNKAPFDDPPRVRSGQKAFLLFTFWRIHDAGLYQRVSGITPGTRLRARAWGHAWSSQDDDPYASVDDDNIALRLGIDPAGGTDPFSDDIVWGKPKHIYDKFGKVSVQATAAADTVTVFLRSSVLWPYKHCDVYWDDAVLEVIPSGGELDEFDVKFRITPAAPKVGEKVSIAVTVDGRLPDVVLSLTDPDKVPVEVGSPRVVSRGQKTTWTFTFTPTQAGTFSARFASHGGSRTQAQRKIKVAKAAAVSKRGKPRAQYERVYMLLPMGAGSEWIQAIIDSGRWDQERWTIGASADDAGIGDLDKRVIVAVNPASWPDDLEAFFAKFYPGVVYKSLEVASPAALRARLKEAEI